VNRDISIFVVSEARVVHVVSAPVMITSETEDVY
jgi:hypothetical protein